MTVSAISLLWHQRAQGSGNELLVVLPVFEKIHLDSSFDTNSVIRGVEYKPRPARTLKAFSQCQENHLPIL